MIIVKKRVSLEKENGELEEALHAANRLVTIYHSILFGESLSKNSLRGNFICLFFSNIPLIKISYSGRERQKQRPAPRRRAASKSVSPDGGGGERAQKVFSQNN